MKALVPRNGSVELADVDEPRLGAHEALVSRTGSPPHNSTAQLPAGRTGEPSEYARYEAGSPAHPAETWIRRFMHRTSGSGH